MSFPIPSHVFEQCNFCYDICPLRHGEMTFPTLINVHTGHFPCSAAVLTGKEWHKMRHTPDNQDNNTYIRPWLKQMFAGFVICHQSFKQSDWFGILCNGLFSSRMLQCLSLLCQFNQPNALGGNKCQPFKPRIKSHLLFAGIIRSSPFSPR